MQPITAPQNRQATTGLVALAAAAPSPAGGDAWQMGFTFDPESCSRGQVLAIDCGPSPDKDDSEHPEFVEYKPAALVVVDSCTTMDRGRDGPGVAGRLMLTRTSQLLEQLLWTGEAETDTTPEIDRPHLADGRATLLAAGAGVSAGAAVALLDQALTDCLGGVTGMVHVAPYTLAVLNAADLLEYDGGRYYTANRHLVVAGSGYTGGGPRPTVGGVLPAAPDLLAAPPENQWMYGTGTVYYLLGATVSETAVDRSVNTVTTVAERAGAAFYGCCQFAVQIDTTPT